MILSTMFTTLSIINIIKLTATLDLSSTGTRFSPDDDTALLFNPELPSMANLPASFAFDQSSFTPSDDSSAPTLFDSAQMWGDAMFSTNDNDLDSSEAFLWNDMDGGIISSSESDNTNESNFFDIDDDESPFQLVDCSTSESLPAVDIPFAFDDLSIPAAFDIAKIRLRRRDYGGEKCTNPDTTPSMDSPSSSLSSSDSRNSRKLNLLGELLGSVEMLTKATAIENPNQNAACYIISDGRLPWGVCSSGRVEEQKRLAETFLSAGARGLAQWRLSRGTLGTCLLTNLVNS